MIICITQCINHKDRISISDGYYETWSSVFHSECIFDCFASSQIIYKTKIGTLVFVNEEIYVNKKNRN